MTTLNIVIITTCHRELANLAPYCSRKAGKRSPQHLPEPTPPITNDRTLLMVGNSLTEAIVGVSWVRSGRQKKDESWLTRETQEKEGDYKNYLEGSLTTVGNIYLPSFSSVRTCRHQSSLVNPERRHNSMGWGILGSSRPQQRGSTTGRVVMHRQ